MDGKKTKGFARRTSTAGLITSNALRCLCVSTKADVVMSGMKSGGIDMMYGDDGNAVYMYRSNYSLPYCRSN